MSAIAPLPLGPVTAGTSGALPLYAVDLDEVLGKTIPAIVRWHNDAYQVRTDPLCSVPIGS